MKILSAKQIREADRFTIKHKPVSSLKLMENAAHSCMNKIASICFYHERIKIFCGTGNNGGDGLAIARKLPQLGLKTEVYVVIDKEKYSADFLTNYTAVKKNKNIISKEIRKSGDIPGMNSSDAIIDALFGSGLNKPVKGIFAEVILAINKSNAKVISIDIPSGMFADESSSGKNNAVVKADHTLTFELPKLAFFFAENADYVDEFYVLPIGLDRDFIYNCKANYYVTGESDIRNILKPRKPFSHKGNFGHALIVAGSYGKMGAAVLAAKACIRSGAGLTTAYIPSCGYNILQTTLPEAMVLCDESEKIISTPVRTGMFNTIGIGPGIGTDKKTADALKNILENFRKPVVLDADAINILAENKSLLKQVPPGSIFTPHPKEFERLVGKTANHFDRNKKQIAFSKKHNCIVVLKGKYSCISTPSGKCWFNPTGNPGMAKGGSGDALTGIITGLLAQGYSAEESAIAGTYIHGLAADIAVKETGEISLTASVIIDNLGKAILQIMQI